MAQLIIWGWKAKRRSQTGPVRVAELQRPCVQVQKVHCPCCTSLSFQCPDGLLSSGKDAWIWSQQHGIELLKWIQSIVSVLLLFIVVFPVLLFTNIRLSRGISDDFFSTVEVGLTQSDKSWRLSVSVTLFVSLRRAVQQCFPLYFNKHVTPEQTTPLRQICSGWWWL